MFSPFLAGGAYFALLQVVGVEGSGRLLQTMLAYIVPPFGKESVIPIGVSVGINPLLVVVSIAVLDFLSALFVYWNYELLKSNKRIGSILSRIEKKSQNTIKNRWFGKAWWLGVGLFMIVPFQGSGAISTTVIGRILGVRRKIFVIIIAGSLLSSAGIGYLSDIINEVFFRSILVSMMF
ncbi:MAG: hypothetical protein GWN01_13000 [Nitrosopumilaceae archaeon]|nr:small multi-drug export protein [Nitrosopumilaceae archaeon]NIV66504.1 hypothetical protein [Nitrosopumilaceae archaeon]NIX62383.1 hypothetical protein [Nitrosopumilaceae archaeon]